MRYVTLQQRRPEDSRGYMLRVRTGEAYWGRYSAKSETFVDKDAKLTVSVLLVDGFWM
jgi:hypothetical protein